MYARRGGRRLPFLCLFVLACIAIAGCDPPVSSAPRPSRATIRIAIVGTSAEDPVWDVLRTVAGQIVSETPRASVAFFAPKDGTPSGQQAVLAELQSADIDAVCLLPVDSESVRDGVRDLIQGGKPVVLLACDVPRSPRSVFVGPSEMEVGQAAARACVRLLPEDRQTVMLLHAGLESSAYGVRYAAFKSQLREEPTGELFKEFDCGGNGVKAQQIIRRQSRLYPRIGGWVLLDDWPLRRLSDSEQLIPLGCSVILCRDDPKYFSAVRRGDIDALVTYDLFHAISEAVGATIRLAEDRRNNLIEHIVIPTEIVTYEDIDWHEERWRMWRKGISGAVRVRE